MKQETLPLPDDLRLARMHSKQVEMRDYVQQQREVRKARKETTKLTSYGIQNPVQR